MVANGMRERVGEVPNELRCLLRRTHPIRRTSGVLSLHLFSCDPRFTDRKPNPGCITVFAAKDKSDWHRARWSPIALGGLCIHEVPADHFDMVWPPHSSLLASYFDAGLDSTQT
jgi:hypothetical protein